jgi:RHS repeat-associated protein
MPFIFNLIIRAAWSAILIAVVLVTTFLQPANAQGVKPAISGPACVTGGTQYSYNIQSFATGTVTYTISGGGVLSTGGSSGSHASGQFSILITWPANFTSGSISATNSAGNTVYSVSVSPAVTGGSITGGQTQTINYNTIPATITCSAPTGGCPSPNYTYQWLYSTSSTGSFTIWSGGTAQDLTFSAGLTSTYYFKRQVTETVSGKTALSSNVATITVYPQLNPGTITPSAISIEPGTSPGQLTGSTPTGGNGTYTYQWWSSPTNSAPWTTVGSSKDYTPAALFSDMYYYRDVNSNGLILPTPTVKVTVTKGVPPATNSTGNINSDMNWLLTTGYDPAGKVLSQEKQFYNNSGRKIQVQDKVFYRKDATTVYSHVFAAQTLRDAYGADVLTTMGAPIDYADFNYMPNFVQATDGSNYTYKNFDRFNPSGTETDKTNNPDPIGGQSVKGTLGWYYGPNNKWEPYTATSTFPYSRTTVYKDGTNNTKKAAAPGEIFRMGSTHETSSYVTPVSGELANYLAIRNKFFSTAQLGSLPANLQYNAIQTVQRDANGTEVLSIADFNGNILMRGRPGTDLTVTNSISIAKISPSYTQQLICLPGTAISLSTFTGGTNTSIYLVSSSGVITLAYSGAVSGAPMNTSLGNGTLMIFSDAVFTVSYSSSGSTNSGTSVPNTGAIIPSQAYFRIFANATPVTITGSYSLYNMENEAPASLNAGTLDKGYYKITSTSGIVNASYGNGYADINYSFYDQLGQMVASITPEGAKKLFGTGINNYSTLASVPFVSTYKYDIRGNLISKTSPDAGTIQLVYRMDGSIRFSQDTWQASNGGSFNYFNYDQYGRMVESGQYLPDASGIAFNSAAMTNILEDVSATGGLTTGTKSDVIMTTYDLLDNSHGQANYNQDAANLAGGISTIKRYKTIVNNAPGSSNLVSQSWYNYDEEGKQVWMIQYIASLGPLVGYKKTDYTYDALGRLTMKTFQKDNSAEIFIHYYKYDPDNGQLWKIYTSTNVANIPDNGAQLQATYVYYLHGKHKRVELAGNLQGIDFTYTLQGALKAINNSNSGSTADPGNDGSNGFYADAFGETLDYYTNDYNNTRTTGIKTIPSVSASGTSDSYTGNIKAMTWYSVKPPGLGSNNPNTYVFNYDPKYQFIAGTYGSPNFGTTPAGFTPSAANQEKVTIPNSGSPGTPAYDANGNILNLQRTDPSGNTSDALAYTYTANTNKLATVTNTGSSPGTYSYSYDGIGRETSENVGVPNSNKYIQYDSRGKVTLVSNDGGPVVGFVYDERGRRIQKISYNTAHQIQLVTYYYDDAIYTQTVTGGTTYGTLSPQEYLVSNGSSRIGVYSKPGNAYVYQLTDHLGNVRAVITNAGATQTAMDYYPFGMPIATLGGSYRYGYQGQSSEMDPETGWNNFELRMYNPRIGRWITMDPKGQFASPYIGIGNNPANGVDPDGSEWVPDANGNLVAEAGDNAQTLAAYLHISVSEAQGMIGSQGLITTGTQVPMLPQVLIGQTLRLDNVFTTALAEQGARMAGDAFLNYNCWGCSLAGSAGKPIRVGVGVSRPDVFDMTLEEEFTPVSASEAIFGKTIIRYTNDRPYTGQRFADVVRQGGVSTDPNAVGGALHGAIYYGTSQDGTIYVFTKNGWVAPPRIMTLNELNVDPTLQYGHPWGLGNTSGFYNPK